MDAGREGLSERFLKQAVRRYFKSLGYSVKMARIRLGNTEIDGEAVGLNGEGIAIEKLKQQAASRKGHIA